MLKPIQVPLKDIHWTEGLRPLNDDYAKVIGASIKEVGQLQPIVIRSTPNAKQAKYTGVFGRTRYRGCELYDIDSISAFVIQADQTLAKYIEVSENLFRYELNTIDRAIFAHTYRELIEADHGEIRAGRNNANLAQLFEGGISSHIADRLGVSKRTYTRLNEIAQKLNPTLREAIRNTPLADNQSALLKLAKMEQADQQRTVVALNETDGDLKDALNLVAGKISTEKPDPQDTYLSRAIEAVSKMTPETFARFEDFLADARAEDWVDENNTQKVAS